MDVVYDANLVTTTEPASCAGQTAANSSNESPLMGVDSGSFSVPVNYVSAIVLTLPSCAGLSFQPGNLYSVELLGVYGNTLTYYQVM